MADCSEIGLMLGAFEDGELEPHEMQEVAFHLARCASCATALGEYSTLGRELRSIVVVPPLDGFANAVGERIANLPLPLGVRVRRLIDRFGDSISAGLAMGGALVAAAALTAVIVTPYARQRLQHDFPTRTLGGLAHATATSIPETEESEALADHAVISSLEAAMPSVAVWSEPRSDTTVIWVPDQP